MGASIFSYQNCVALNRRHKVISIIDIEGECTYTFNSMLPPNLWLDLRYV